MKILPVSVIVVTRNAGSTLAQCLCAVANNYPSEILVVDGNSTDTTVQIARQYTNIVLSDEGNGLAFARQFGAEHANQEYIAYIDADVVLSNGALEQMLNELREQRFSAISATIVAGKSATYWERATQAHINMLVSRKAPLGLAASLFLKQVIIEHGFDPRFPRLDDVDLAKKMQNDGLTYGVSQVTAMHYHRSTLRDFSKQRFVNGRAKAQYLWKHGILHFYMWSPLTTVYMTLYSIARNKLWLIPYFITGGAIETVGLTKGMWELVLTKLSLQKSRHRLT